MLVEDTPESVSQPGGPMFVKDGVGYPSDGAKLEDPNDDLRDV